MKFKHAYLFLALLFSIASCRNTAARTSSTPLFETKPLRRYVSPGMIDEASGIAEGKANKDVLWVEQDSGNPSEIYRLGKDGVLRSKVTLKNLRNRDWEDIVLSNGPMDGVNYLYLAETGDNSRRHADYFIYRFPEPPPGADTVFSVDQIKFNYPDESHDAEAILVDPASKDIFIITKRDAYSKIFKLRYPQDLTGANTAVLMGQLPFNGVVSAALSPDSREIIIKTYTDLFYWKKNQGESIPDALKRSYSTLSYSLEPQGEAVCFAADNSGFFTLSEKPFPVSSVDLNFYKRRKKVN